MDEQEKRLIINTLDAIGLRPPKPATERDIKLAQYSDELKRIIIRAIEACPAMEETFLTIAELAFMDGEDNVG
jgi:hypothetical protein